MVCAASKKNYYFSERIRRRLERIPTHRLTVVEAPSGFGKTTAVREYLNALSGGARVVWRTIGEENRLGEWDVLCRVVGEADPQCGSELGALSVPWDDECLPRMEAALAAMRHDGEVYLVVDNYQFVRSRIPERYLRTFYGALPEGVHLILVTQLVNPVPRAIVGDAQVNHIRREHLNFDTADIAAYYGQLGLRLTDEQAEGIRRFSGGWAAGVYLTALGYSEAGTLQGADDIRALIRAAVWDKLSDAARLFLLRLCSFDSFDLDTARFLNETDWIDESILDMLERNGFVWHDMGERRYYIHSILQLYVKKEFDACSGAFRERVLRLTAQWHEKQGDNFLALRYYALIGDFRAALSLPLTTSDFTLNASSENRELLLSVLDRCPPEIRAEYPRAMIVFAFALFIYNETERVVTLAREVEKNVAAGPAMSAEEKRALTGEIVFLTAFLSYNDFAAMAGGYRRAVELTGGPTSIINMKGAWTFGAPSILYMFYRSAAERDVQILEKNLPYYLAAARGHGTGADVVMRGELQFNRGDFKAAEISAHRAAYAAREAQQLNIELCALFLLAQIALARGDAAEYRSAVGALRGKARASKSVVYLNMLGLCEGFLGAECGVGRVPEWLAADDVTSRVRFMARPYASVVYAKSLLDAKKYARLAGIGPELKRAASFYPNAMALIYTGLHVAAAHEALGAAEEAERALRGALDIALPDGVILPLAQNFGALSPILKRLLAREFLSAASLKKISALAKVWSQNLQCARAALLGAAALLSERELEAAELVARGLTNDEIARQMHVSAATVKSFLARAFRKTGSASRTELTAWLLRRRN